MHHVSRRLFTIAACTVALGIAHAQAPSANWPAKPIKVVVPSPPGGPPTL